MKLFSKIAAGVVLGLSALSVSAGTLDISVNGVLSIDEEGNINNTIIIVPLAAPATITGIGWDVSIETIGGSWLSEAVVSVGPVGGPSAFNLTPGAGDGFPGIGNYSSGGIIVLADVGIPDLVLADGMLQLEFFESFVDNPGTTDAEWSGTLTIECLGDCTAAMPTPEPGILVLLGLGLVGVVAARRRS